MGETNVLTPAPARPSGGRATALLLRFLPLRPSDEDELRSALLTAAVGVLFALISPLYALLIRLLEEPPGIYYGAALVGFITAAGSLWLLWRGKFRFAAWWLLVGGSAAVMVPFLREGARSQAAGNFVIVIVMAALLVGWRGVLILGSAFGALVLGLGVLQQRGIYDAVPETSSRGVFALMQIVSVVVMLVLFDRVRLGILRARRELEARLLQAQRLEAVGRLAGGVAHDFNNLLTIILANASLLDRPDQPQAPELEQIQSASLRAAELTRQLLAFASQQRLEPRTFDLGAMLDAERALLARLLPDSVHLETQTAKVATWIHADPGQLSQVLMNLVANARDAMPDGGTLGVVVERVAARETSLARAPHTGEAVVLRVTDSGVGMDAETLERAFEPFFSTKTSGAGTGLGLATVHGIVTQSGGTIGVTSKPGRGTTFQIAFPAASEPRTEATLRPSTPRATTTRLSILLVEDDDQVRASTAQMLRKMGHGVTEANGAAEALRAWQADAEHIDVIVTDVVMPERSGPSLARDALEHHPARVLFVSGYLHHAVDDELLRQAAFLSKPFTEDELRSKLEEVCARPRMPQR